MSSKL